MVLRKREKSNKPLTEVELELMNIIWQLGECTIKEVQESLPQERDLAYTSVATIIRILEEKKVLGSRKKDRAKSYYPLLSKSDYETTALRHMTHNVFQGDATSVVMRLLDDSDLSQKELESIRAFMKERFGQ